MTDDEWRRASDAKRADGRESVGGPVGNKSRAQELAELAGGLAHELRNPLSTMMVHLRLLAEDLTDESVGASDVRRRGLVRVEALQKEASRLQSLFDDFLNVAGPCELERTSADLGAIAEELCDFFEPVIRGTSVELVLERGEHSVPAPLDEKLVRQALLNLVINARDAMPEGGRLGVRVFSEEGFACVTVSDEGVGISEEDLQRISRPFFTSKGRASGLGLSITKRIVEEHGGRLEVRSLVGEGSAFTLRFPQ